MADMEELFGSSDEGSDNGKQGSDQNDGSDNEMEQSDNEGADSADGNVDSDNDHGNGGSEEEEPSSPVESGNEMRESSDERQSDAHSDRGDSEDDGGASGVNADSDNQNASENEEGGSNNADSDNENADSGNENVDSEVENVGSDNENANSDDEQENARASDDEGSYDEQTTEKANVESEEENEGSDQGGSDNERNSDQDGEGSGNEQENENQAVSGGESDREMGSDSEQGQDQEHSAGGQSDGEVASEDGQNAISDDEDAEHGSGVAESDNDNESQENKKSATAEALFGDADDISSGSDAEGKIASREDNNENDGSVTGSVKGSPVQTAEDGHDEEAQDEPQPEEIPETRIDVEIPKISTDLGKEIHFVKLPNFISVETRPFDHQTYEDEIDEDEVLDEEGRARLKLKVENTVRWRWGYDSDGNPVKESNARIVKWSDGSMSLHLGSEIFDVHKQLLQGDHNHLFIRQGTGLQGQAVFRTKLTFRPHSTDSFTHRKITMSVADRSQKTQKIRILPTVGKDPEAHRSEMIKKEEDRLKASIRRENKQRRMKERALSRGLSSSYLEPDRYDDEDEDDEGAISLAAIKNKYKKGALRENRPPIYSSDSDASDIDDRRARRLEKAKALSDSEGSVEDVGPKKKMARIEESDED